MQKEGNFVAEFFLHIDVVGVRGGDNVPTMKLPKYGTEENTNGSQIDRKKSWTKDTEMQKDGKKIWGKNGFFFGVHTFQLIRWR